MAIPALAACPKDDREIDKQPRLYVADVVVVVVLEVAYVVAVAMGVRFVGVI